VHADTNLLSAAAVIGPTQPSSSPSRRNSIRIHRTRRRHRTCPYDTVYNGPSWIPAAELQPARGPTVTRGGWTVLNTRTVTSLPAVTITKQVPVVGAARVAGATLDYLVM